MHFYIVNAYTAAMKNFLAGPIGARRDQPPLAKGAGVKPPQCICHGASRPPQMLNERGLLRRLRSLRAAFGPAVADEAIRRAALAVAKAVHEFAEHRATQAKSRPSAAAVTPTDSQAGSAPAAEGRWRAMGSGDGDIP
jgi:hypothetical protein